MPLDKQIMRNPDANVTFLYKMWFCQQQQNGRQYTIFRTDKTDLELCHKCHKMISSFELPEHLDYHFAKENIQQAINHINLSIFLLKTSPESGNKPPMGFLAIVIF